MTPKEKLALVDAVLAAEGSIERGGWVSERNLHDATLVVDGSINADRFLDNLFARLVQLGWRSPA